MNSSRVNDIAIDPDNDTVYIVASQGTDYPGKIYKSKNGGASFSEVLIAEKQSDFNVVTLDPSNPQHLFAGGEGLWESEDGGESWEQTELKRTVNAILIDPQNPDIMYAGGHSISAKTFLYKSIDGSVNWQPSILEKGWTPQEIEPRQQGYGWDLS